MDKEEKESAAMEEEETAAAPLIGIDSSSNATEGQTENVDQQPPDEIMDDSQPSSMDETPIISSQETSSEFGTSLIFPSFCYDFLTFPFVLRRME